MQTDSNPYAAPQSDTALPDAAASPGELWLAGGGGNLRMVYWGLSLMYWGILLMLLGMVVVVAGAFIDARPAPWRSPVALVGFGMLGMATLFGFVGPLLCLPAPAASGTRLFIITSVVLQLLSCILAFLPALGIIGGAASLSSTILFILFMWRLAKFIGQPALAARAMRVIVGGVVVVCLGILFVVTAAMVGNLFAGAAGVTLLVGVLIVFVMYANLLNDLRKKLRSYFTPVPAAITAS